MSFDSVTEKIAHFIGTFDLTIEQARLRDQYEEFTAQRRKAELEELADPQQINVKADLDLDAGKYGPLPYRFNPPEQQPELPAVKGFPLQETFVALNPPSDDSLFIVSPDLFGSRVETKIIYIETTPEYVYEFNVETELIGSAVTYTFQTLYMNDNDTVGEGDFRDTETLIAMTEAAAETAASLHAISTVSYDVDDYLSVDYVEALAEEMMSVEMPEIEGVTVHQFQGDAAIGIIVNGEYVDEAPVWADLLPAYHQPDEEDEDAGPSPLPAEWNQDDDDGAEDGHTVVTGGNLAINQVAATIAWLDAPFIVVGGKAVSLTAISQVALVSDMDKGAAGHESGTNVVQSTEIAFESKTAHWLPEGAGEGEQPMFVSVDWIHGDLIVTNFVKQIIDATDIDHIQTEISAASTLYALGDNQLVNISDLVQLGTYYDVILIGGNMVSVDVLHQTLVLMDDDVVTGGLALADDQSDENLLMNQATVTTEGQDTHEELNDNLAGALDLTQSDMDALEDALLNDPTFAGMEQLRVLKIDGSLLQVNVVEQVTVLADQDDVHLAGGAAEATEVVSGSNALLNAANITKAGIDSTVMAADGSYSELLIHQASLIDVPDNEEIEEIANEAIALMLEENGAVGDKDGFGPNPADLTPAELTNASDGLQSMLA